MALDYEISILRIILDSDEIHIKLFSIRESCDYDI